MSADSVNKKLRMPGKDYTDPGYYFCTMVVLGRRKLLGHVVEVSDAGEASGQRSSHSLNPEDNGELRQKSGVCSGRDALHLSDSEWALFGHTKPHKGACIAYSPFGLRVAIELENICNVGRYAGKVEIKGKIIMPDHIHILLFVKERLPRPIGVVLNGVIIGSRRAWKRICGISIVEWKGNTPVFASCKNEAKTGKWQLPTGQECVPLPQEDGELRLFESGYNDEVVSRRGQLNGYYEYMNLNPWRELQKMKFPNLFTKVWGKELLPGIRFNMVGNMFLLQKPKRVAVRISRFATLPPADADSGVPCDVYGRTRYVYPKREKTEEEIGAAIEPFVKASLAGAVLITPCISPAEKAVVEAAYKAGGSVIMFCPQGFSKGYHPSKSHYEACAEGKLLQLSYLPFDPGRKLTKVLCEELNEMARRFADAGGEGA